MRKTHCLKTWPEMYKAVESGQKTFEFRKNDRDFHVGDDLILQEYDPDTKKFTRKEQKFNVTFMMEGDQFGTIPDGYCILSIKEPYGD